MSYVYAMSDIHGCPDALDAALALVDLSGNNKLVLCGDYIHGPDSYAVLDRIMELERKHGKEKVIVLMGNHEDMALDGRWGISASRFDAGFNDHDARDDKYLMWFKQLRRYYVEGNTIFVHAGVDEEAEDWWEWGTDDYTFTEKYPADFGHFYMDIVAGHVGTAQLSGDPRFHDIYFDGQSHYYIDGTTLDSGIVPVLKLDTKAGKYFRVTESGEWLILPYNEEY